MVSMRDIVNSAFEEIGVKAAEISITDSELQSGISRCNDMLIEWDQLGTIKGYKEVLNGDDILNVERHAVGAIKYNLAVILAPSYQKIVTPALAAIADSKLMALQATANDLSEIAYPDTLPLGSGNECGNSYYKNRFFPENEKVNF